MAPSALTIIKVRKTLIADKFLKLNFKCTNLPFNICIAISLGAVIDDLYTVMITAFSICEVLL